MRYRLPKTVRVRV